MFLVKTFKQLKWLSYFLKIFLKCCLIYSRKSTIRNVELKCELRFSNQNTKVKTFQNYHLEFSKDHFNFLHKASKNFVLKYEICRPKYRVQICSKPLNLFKNALYSSLKPLDIILIYLNRFASRKLALKCEQKLFDQNIELQYVLNGAKTDLYPSLKSPEIIWIFGVDFQIKNSV